MRNFTLFILLTVFGLSTQAQNFFDDFDSYTPGAPLGPQSVDWTTWSGVDGGADDVNVVTTDAHSGSNSLYFSSTSATGGPSDCVLPFGGVYNTGQFSFDAWFKVPASKTAYFNFQADATIGTTWTLEVFMTALGGLECRTNGGTVLLTSTFPQGAWFNLKFFVNFNTNSWEVFVNNTSVGTFTNNVTQIASLDIYPADASAQYWVDDVSYTVIPFTLPTLNGALNSLNIPDGLTGQSVNPTVIVRNLGQDPINSFDLVVNYNGNQITENITGVNITSLNNYTVNFTNTITMAAGVNTATAVISNVNGLGADGDASDDTQTDIFTQVTPATGKVVVVEEATGTWCQWCPRGAVYMDMMAAKYDGFVAGIAVHNNDPMTVAPYDSAIGTKIGGYPSALVDRLPEVDPSAIEAPFLQRIVLAPKGILTNGALWNSTTRELKVSVSTIITQAFSGNYKINCVLTEDDVTGTTSAYNQSNAYAGGGNGVMGGFEALPNPVPAAQMVYNHVARAISPGWVGIPNAIAGAAVGDTVVHNFTFTLPASWDDTKMHIVSMLLEPSGKVDNAGTANIAKAIANGYVEASGPSSVEFIQGPDDWQLYPNPASDFTGLTLNIKETANVKVDIYNASGVLVASKSYGKMGGAVYLPVQLNDFATGMYFVKVRAGETGKIFKLLVKK